MFNTIFQNEIHNLFFFFLNMEHPLDISLLELIIQGVRPL